MNSILPVLCFIFALGCGGSSSTESVPLCEQGYGFADTWHLEPVERVDEIRDAGLKYVLTEEFPTVQEADWRKGQTLEAFPLKAREWNRRICENGQVHIVFLVNWNVLPHRRMGDEWFREVLNRALSIYDPSCTWLEAIVEPDEEQRLAQRWTQWAADVWPGKFIVPIDGAHWPVRRDYIDIHPRTVGDARRLLEAQLKNVLVITDGGEFLNLRKTLPDIAELAVLSRIGGVPFIVYADRERDPLLHSTVIGAIGGCYG